MKIVGYLILLLAGVGIDRLTKWWALVNNVDFSICPVLNFSLLWNRGVSWGLFHEASSFGFYVLTTFIIFVTIGLAFYTFYFQLYKNKACVFFETIVLSGAISNIIDRFAFGGVVDFIQVHLGNWYFPTFNVADVLVVCGVVYLLIQNIVRSHEYQN